MNFGPKGFCFFFFRIELSDKIQEKEITTFFILSWLVHQKIKEVSTDIHFAVFACTSETLSLILTIIFMHRQNTWPAQLYFRPPSRNFKG